VDTVLVTRRIFSVQVAAFHPLFVSVSRPRVEQVFELVTPSEPLACRSRGRPLIPWEYDFFWSL